ncbi:MAG TPA: hypothetical protein VMV27_05100 [Candidatus Binataceae bacterium]|nr:hypothetical protein [Candidatus Binataceae bacterium]
MPTGEHNDPGQPGHDQWRLGIDPAERPAPSAAPSAGPSSASPQPAAAARAARHSERRLERVLIVVTLEHLGWLIVVGYTIATRLAALGVRPMFPYEAARALGEFALARGLTYPVAAANGLGWIGLAQIGVFRLMGGSDFSARLSAAVGAMVVIGAVFALRREIGRAGALGMAALLALSPTMTYFSRAGTTSSIAIALVMTAVAMAGALARRPTAPRTAGFALALVLALGAGAIGALDILTGAGALAIVAVVNAAAGGNPVLRIRVWWTRRGWLVVLGTIAVAAIWIFLTELLSAAPLSLPLAASLAPLGAALGRAEVAVPRLYLAILGFYEFAIVLAAIVGAAAIVARRVKSHFAGWCLAWAIVSLAVWTIARPQAAEFAPGFLVPLALLGAFGLDWMHQLGAWDAIRYAAAALAALTLYAQLVTNVVVAAPDAAEASWERRGSLLWSDPATTLQTRAECARALAMPAARGATAALPDDAPALAWYLRELEPANTSAGAGVVATRITSGTSLAERSRYQFGFEERWIPDFGKLTAANAARFFLTARVWSEVEINDMALEVAAPASAPSAAAAVSPSPTATPAANSSSPATAAPTAQPTAAPTPAPAAAPTSATL